jgi:hypothetical protein
VEGRRGGAHRRAAHPLLSIGPLLSKLHQGCPKMAFLLQLKVPKCEIFNRLDFHDFYTIKVPQLGDLGVKIKIK